MVKDMTYTTISQVIETWENLRRQDRFEERVGTLALLKLFELEPRTKSVFNFKTDYNPTPEELKSSGNLVHAVMMINMFDNALNLLGPDTETLQQILHGLGKRHIKYGVKAHFFPFMGQAILYALSETMGEKWTDNIQEAWTEVYEELSGEIMKSILQG